MTTSADLPPGQQCGSGTPQSSGTLEPPAGPLLPPWFLLRCPATQPSRLPRTGNPLSEDRRAWATRGGDEPVLFRLDSMHLGLPPCEHAA